MVPVGVGERAVARVGGSPITRADLEGYLRLRPPERGATVSAEAVRKRLDEIVQAEVLYREALRIGIDRDPAVRQTIRQVVVQRMLEQEIDRPVGERNIEEAELKAFYDAHLAEFARPEQVRLVDIFFAAPAGGDAAVRKEKKRKAEEVLSRARGLQDTRFGFGELVLANSDTHPRYPRGDTGFLDRKGGPLGLPEALAAAAFAIPKVGKIAERVVETPEGFHVVMLTGRRDAEHRVFEDERVRGEIEQRIRSEERRRRHQEFVDGVRGKTETLVDESALAEIVAEMNAAVPRGDAGGNDAPARPTAPGAAPPSLPTEGHGGGGR